MLPNFTSQHFSCLTYIYLFAFRPSPWLEGKLHEIGDFVRCMAVLLGLGECLAHSRWSVNIGWVREWVPSVSWSCTVMKGHYSTWSALLEAYNLEELYQKDCGRRKGCQHNWSITIWRRSALRCHSYVSLVFEDLSGGGKIGLVQFVSKEHTDW